MREWTQQELYAEEERLESLTHIHGMRKYWHTAERAKQRQDEASTIPVRSLIEAYLPIVSKEIVTKCAKQEGQRSGIAQKYLRPMNADILALISLRVVLDGISSPRTLTSVARNIGTHVEDEARFTALDRKQMKNILPAIKHKSDYMHRHIAATKYAGVDYQDGWQPWGKEEDEGEKIKIHVGVFLIDAILASTDLIRDILVTVYPSRNTGKCGHTTHKIVPTEEALKAIRARHLDMLDLFPEYNPMVIVPKQWTAFDKGGYYTDNIPQQPFVRTRWKAHRELLRQSTAQMKEVYAGVNAVQNTPWRINETVLHTLNHFYTNKIAAAGLPYQNMIEPPCCPVCGGAVETPHKCFEHDEKALDVWKKLKLRWHKTLLANDSKTELIGRVIQMAEKYVDYPAIYFPMSCDFRGRIYSIPNYLSPQGSDYSKGLLEFAEGKKVETPEALMWLKIAGANHYGIDKAPFAERCKWVEDNTDEILRIASSPLDFTSWTKADEPFQYLAWCCDYANYIKDPQNYESHAVVAMDGSCNGLQHFSALLRDPDGAQAVNLTPSEKPSDIYQIVADKVIDKLRHMLNNPKTVEAKDREFAQRWLAVGISRKTTKRSVMIVPYSGTRLACREYIQDFLDEKIDKQIETALSENYSSGLKYLEIDSAIRKNFPFESVDKTEYDTFKAASWLSKYVWDAIEETIVSAKEAMGFLQKTAKLLAKENKPVCWTTPTGFPVRMSYFDEAKCELKTKLQDTYMHLNLMQDTADISSKQQTNAVSPNFIHSMDASCLIKTVNTCIENNITSFGMVHDSYGTVAADAPVLAKTLRQEFIALYEENSPLEDFHAASMQELQEESDIPVLPMKRDLQLPKVMESLYFFA